MDMNIHLTLPLAALRSASFDYPAGHLSTCPEKSGSLFPSLPGTVAITEAQGCCSVRAGLGEIDPPDFQSETDTGEFLGAGWRGP